MRFAVKKHAFSKHLKDITIGSVIFNAHCPFRLIIWAVKCNTLSSKIGGTIVTPSLTVRWTVFTGWRFMVVYLFKGWTAKKYHIC